MIGAIVGDIVGSRFEFHNLKSKDFKLFHPDCRPTDDTVMTLAVGDALMEHLATGCDLAESAVRKMQGWGLRYLDAGYGAAFLNWLAAERPRPYYSWGNGAAMRVSFCGWAGKTLKDAVRMAHEVTRVTHDHPEGLAGAEIVAALVFLARRGIGRNQLRDYVEAHYRKIDFTLDEIRPTYEFDVSCQGSVPQAIVAFLESTDFIDAIRNAVSIGGDSDTIAAITGSIAEAFYGVPEEVREKALPYLDSFQQKTLLECERKLFRLHVTGAGWDSLSADGSLVAAVDPEFAVEMGLIPSLQDLLEEAADAKK